MGTWVTTKELSEYKVLSYDDLFGRYENGKLLLRELTTSFQGSFESLKSVITQHSNDENQPFISALSSVLETTRTSIGSLLADPDLFKPTRLAHQISEYQSEKSEGMDMMRNLQSKIDSLNEEKRNWLLQKQKGQKLIEQYKLQLDAVSNSNTLPTTTTNYSNNQSVSDRNEVQELTYELELAQSNAGDLRKLTDSLSSENKSLSHQVLTLREQNNNLQKQKFKKTNGASINDKQQQQIDKLEQKCRLLEQELNGYKQRLVAKGGNAKQLYRADTVTKWSENDLAQIQNDLQQALQAQHQQNIAEQMDKQYNLRTEHQYKMKVTDAASD